MNKRLLAKVFIYIKTFLSGNKNLSGVENKNMTDAIVKKCEFKALDIANTFIEIGKDQPVSNTNMKLQKLSYYAQGWYLAVTNKPLFDEDFEKWDLGPVCPILYEKFKHKKAAPIICGDIGGDIIEDERILAFINKIWEMYGGFTGIELSKLSHNESPWIEAEYYKIIPKQKIKEFFCAKLKSS